MPAAGRKSGYLDADSPAESTLSVSGRADDRKNFADSVWISGECRDSGCAGAGIEGPGGSVKRRPGKRFFDGLLPDFQRLSGRVADYAGSGLDFAGHRGAAGRLRVLCGKRRAEAV